MTLTTCVEMPNGMTKTGKAMCVNATVWVDAVLDTYWKEYVIVADDQQLC